jgi:hypothetical protein
MRVDVEVPASHGASSAVWPVRMLTTPPGTSEVARTSARVIAGSGRSVSLATTTHRVAGDDDGATTRPARAARSAAARAAATTPVGSGTERLK